MRIPSIRVERYEGEELTKLQKFMVIVMKIQTILKI